MQGTMPKTAVAERPESSIEIGESKKTAKAFNSFQIAQAQFDKVAEYLGLDQPTKDLLRYPLREYQFAIPVRMDDGRARVFRGFRVQHNDARGPGNPLPPLLLL